MDDYLSDDLVNLLNGNMVYQVTDVEAKSGRLPLRFRRTYNSLSPDIGPLGTGWTHSYNVWLDLKAEPAQVYLHAHDGAVFEFQDLGGGIYTPPPGIHRTLTDNLDGTWTLRYRNGVMQHFETVPSPFTGLLIGRLTSIEDRHGNAAIMGYDGAGDLTTIADPTGRTVTLTYNLDHYIVGLTDPLSRTFTYEYTDDSLTSVTYPNAITATYTYADGQMTSLDDPWAGPDRPPASYTYDSPGSGRVIRVDTAAGTQEIGYGAGTTVLTNALGYPHTIQYDGEFNVLTTTNALGDVTGYTYDLEHNVTSRTDANGHETTYTYDPNGSLATLTNPQGQKALYTHDPLHNQLLEFTDLLSRTTTYTYDPVVGNLVHVTDPLTGVTSYGYDGGCCLPTVITDTNGHPTYYEYDAWGNRTVTTDSLGYTTVYTYDILGRFLGKTDANGHTTNVDYDAAGNLVTITDTLGTISTYSYDPVGNRISETDANGHTISYSYDPLNRLVVITDALGTISTYSYDPVGNRISETDANGHAIGYSYDPLNRLVVITDALGYVSTYSYDPVGNRISETDANGNTAYYQYDDLDRATTITDALGYTINYSYDPVGNRISETDANGHPISYSYDPLNRLVVITDALGYVSTYSYDPVGNRISETDADGNITDYSYDPLNRLVVITDALGTISTYSYDPIGNRISETDANGHTIDYSYDPLNRLVVITDALDYTIGYSYDPVGNRISETDANGHTIGYSYDPLNRLVVITDALGYVSTYSYDPVGNRISETDANGHTTGYSYDPLNRLIKEQTADGESKRYAYDGVGNITVITDANGTVVTYTYDALHHLTDVAVNRAAGVGGVTFEHYEYDPLGRLTLAQNNLSLTTWGYDDLSRVLTETQNGETITYQYDSVGNRVRLTYPDGRFITYQYDDANRINTINDGPLSIADYDHWPTGEVEHIAYGNGTTLDAVYDANRRITTINHGITPGADFEYGYDAVGNQQYELRPHDGKGDAYAYDAVHQLTDVQYGLSDPVGGSGDQEGEASYVLDGVGNRVTAAMTTTTESQALSYTTNEVNEYQAVRETLDRMVLSYDDNGNLIGIATTPAKKVYLPLVLNAFTGTTTALTLVTPAEPPALTFTTDATAVLTTRQYDYRNRPVSVTLVFTPANGLVTRITTTFKYDAVGRRIARTTDATATLYYYDGPQVIEEREGGSPTAQYVYGPGIDQVLQMRRGGQDYYYHTNSLGSVTHVTDAAGQVVEQYTYDVYGQPVIQDGAGTPLTESAIGNPYLFAGRRYDARTGSYHYRARDYDPKLGRFLQRDPLGPINGPNLYTYVGNNPVNRTDPLGLGYKVASGVGGEGLMGGLLDEAEAWLVLECGDDCEVKDARTGQHSSGLLLQFDISFGDIRDYEYDCPDGSKVNCKRVEVTIKVSAQFKLGQFSSETRTLTACCCDCCDDTPTPGAIPPDGVSISDWIDDAPTSTLEKIFGAGEEQRGGPGAVQE